MPGARVAVVNLCKGESCQHGKKDQTMLVFGVIFFNITPKDPHPIWPKCFLECITDLRLNTREKHRSYYVSLHTVHLRLGGTPHAFFSEAVNPAWDDGCLGYAGSRMDIHQGCS